MARLIICVLVRACGASCAPDSTCSNSPTAPLLYQSPPNPRKANEITTPLWYLTKDGDVSCLHLHRRHYSKYTYADGRKPNLFVGPGDKIVLRTERADAVFAWRKFIDDSGNSGVNCAVFRNESPHKASELIRQADAIADYVWPGERHYTHVNPEAVRGTCPGYCFIRAGWRRCGKTASGLLTLHRLPVNYPVRTEGVDADHQAAEALIS